MAFSSTSYSAASTAPTSAAYTCPNEIGTVIIQNTDASVTVYVGGSDVSSANGFKLLAGASLSVEPYPGEKLYLRSASGTVDVRILQNGV